MSMELETEPAAWLVPHLMNFKDATKVHFTRVDGCNKTDEELMEHFTGTVVYSAETVFLDDKEYYVEDKEGVKHYVEPLYRALKKGEYKSIFLCSRHGGIGFTSDCTKCKTQDNK